MPGSDAEALAAEHVASGAETADHFVGYEQDVVPAQHSLNLIVVAGLRNDAAAGSHERFGNEGADRIRPLALDQIFQRACATRHKVFFGFTE